MSPQSPHIWIFCFCFNCFLNLFFLAWNVSVISRPSSSVVDIYIYIYIKRIIIDQIMRNFHRRKCYACFHNLKHISGSKLILWFYFPVTTAENGLMALEYLGLTNDKQGSVDNNVDGLVSVLCCKLLDIYIV